MGKYSCAPKCTHSLPWAPAAVRHWGQTCMTLAAQTASCAISGAAHHWCCATSCLSKGQRQPQAEGNEGESCAVTTEQDRQVHRNINSCQLESHSQAPRPCWHLHTVDLGGSRSNSRNFNHDVTETSTLLRGEWLWCWCDPQWNALVWCLGRFRKLQGLQGELREPPEASSSHDSRCWDLGGLGSQGSQMPSHL